MCHFRRPWNGMFDRHQAEITVMLFTGHSLPVHQSMTVPWDFTLSHIVSQARLRQWNMQLPRLWNGMFGGVGGQYTTIMGPKQILPLQVRVSLGVMAMKGYSTLPSYPELKPHHQMQFTQDSCF